MANVSDLQPTLLGRVIAGTTGTLAIAATGLYEVLKSIGVPIEWLAEPSVRLALACGVFAFGMALLNIHLLRHISRLEKGLSAAPTLSPQIAPNIATPQTPAPAKIEPHIEDLEGSILQDLANVKSELGEHFAKRYKLNQSRIDYHLERLEKLKFIYAPLLPGRPRLWQIDQLGREWLHNRKRL